MKKRFNVFHHIDQQTINEMFESYSPVFVLSTGRSGSKYIHHILTHSESLASFHEAFPYLMYFSNFAYHNQHQSELLQSMFQAARMEMILDAFNNNKIYVESNQCLTFFASAINSLYKNARFVHLIRHPGDFIRSALMKGWHVNDSIWESGRVKMSDSEVWKALDQIEKLAWVWGTTNAYISAFLENLAPGYCLTIRLEDITTYDSELEKLMFFIHHKTQVLPSRLAELKKQKVNELVIHDNEPSNMKKINTFPGYKDWPMVDKQKIEKYVKIIANKYDYVL